MQKTNRNRKSKLSQERINWSTSHRKIYNGLRIGNTYDNRRKLVISNNSINDISVHNTISPKESLYQTKPRKTNKTPMSRYVSAAGASNLHRNQLPLNFFTNNESSQNIGKIKIQKAAENGRGSRYKPSTKTQRPTPRLF